MLIFITMYTLVWAEHFPLEKNWGRTQFIYGRIYFSFEAVYCSNNQLIFCWFHQISIYLSSAMMLIPTLIGGMQHLIALKHDSMPSSIFGYPGMQSW